MALAPLDLDTLMTDNDELYDIFNLSREASQEEITAAYKRLQRECHPDRVNRDPDSQKDATERFCTVVKIYDILGNQEKRKKYDDEGLDAVVAEGIRTIYPGDLDRAKAAFEDFDLRENDPSLKELLQWWSRPETSELDAHSSLRTTEDHYLDQLKALYEQFRVTHADSTGRDPLSQRASNGEVSVFALDAKANTLQAILKIADKYFGNANASRLRGWNGNDDLTPLMDGKYFDSSGQLVKLESGESVVLLKDIESLHLKYTSEFTALLKAGNGHQKPALKKLDAHSAQYADWWHTSDKREFTHEEKKLLGRFKRTIEWTEIADQFKTLERLQGSPHGKLTLRDEHISPETHTGRSSGPSQPSTEQPTVVSEDKGTLPDADSPAVPITVRDGGVDREVFAFRESGFGSHLFLRMSPPDAPFQLYDVVSGKMFRRSFKQIKQHTDLDFKNMKSDKDDLQEKDFGDLDWFGIATQRRGLEPEGGWASQPQTHLLCREDGAVKAYTRTDMGSIFGKADVDTEIHAQRIAAGGQKALPAPPTRKAKAIRYDLRHNDNDTDAEDDLAFVTTHPDDVPRLLEDTTQPEQQEADHMMELVKALSRSARISDHARGKDRRATSQAFAPPSTQQEAQKMQEAINLYRQGQNNTALYA
ncbi:DnaJ (Hsp40), subfamily C, member 11 [Elasticomyces elasticus]|nr:DnaJ (Hsp40), subfamily C, member 11 [Elasticomyces elasticus]